MVALLCIETIVDRCVLGRIYKALMPTDKEAIVHEIIGSLDPKIADTEKALAEHPADEHLKKLLGELTVERVKLGDSWRDGQNLYHDKARSGLKRGTQPFRGHIVRLRA